MIIYIEGPRNVGKTYLLNSYFDFTLKYNLDLPKAKYYKFYFADHFKTLGLEWIEDSPALHYFSLGNIMTIMEMNELGSLNEILVFDRAIISAYTWAVVRKRLSLEKAIEEMTKLLKSKLFVNSKTIVIKHNTLGVKDRVKDAWDEFNNEVEWEVMQKLITAGLPYFTDESRGNSLEWVENDFSNDSKKLFVQKLESFRRSLNK